MTPEDEVKALRIALSACMAQRNAALNQAIDAQVAVEMANARIKELEKPVEAKLPDNVIDG